MEEEKESVAVEEKESAVAVEEKESAVEEEKVVKGGGGKEIGDVGIAGTCNDVRAKVKKNGNRSMRWVNLVGRY